MSRILEVPCSSARLPLARVLALRIWRACPASFGLFDWTWWRYAVHVKTAGENRVKVSRLLPRGRVTIVTRRVARSRYSNYGSAPNLTLSCHGDSRRILMFTRVAKPLYSRCNTVRKLSTDASLKIFSDPRSAEFLAAAATVESLPTIGNRPPEVCPVTYSWIGCVYLMLCDR